MLIVLGSRLLNLHRYGQRIRLILILAIISVLRSYIKPTSPLKYKRVILSITILKLIIYYLNRTSNLKLYNTSIIALLLSLSLFNLPSISSLFIGLPSITTISSLDQRCLNPPNSCINKALEPASIDRVLILNRPVQHYSTYTR